MWCVLCVVFGLVWCLVGCMCVVHVHGVCVCVVCVSVVSVWGVGCGVWCVGCGVWGVGCGVCVVCVFNI